MVVLPPSFTPSLIDCAAFESLKEAWTFASVRSLAFNCFPILVLALPSFPWHCAQCLSQFAFASAARSETVEATKRLTIMQTMAFIIGFLSMNHFLVVSTARPGGTNFKSDG